MNASHQTSLHDSRGFTLVEVMMAMLILTVGLLGLLQSIQVAYQHNARNRLREEAVLIAEEQMNGLKALQYGNVTANHSISIDRGVSGGIKRYTINKSCQEMGGPDLSQPKAKRLTVSVSWIFKNMTTRHEIYSVKTE